ncbi:MAG: ATP-binding cassette domain-containing protein [Deltaproteobacteria bacterium]|nr:ATP-binding cassette domain-containing protein [Deltaproteobacteria bacterium]
MSALLEVHNIKKYFPVMNARVFQKTIGYIRAVDDVSFSLHEGKTFGLVGESGCGKSTIAKVILQLEKATSGSIVYRGKDMTAFNKSDMRKYHGSVQAVFQDPTCSLNPRMRIESIVEEPLVVNKKVSAKEVKQSVAETLDQVGINSQRARCFPHEFSGGQRQRIAMARALIVRPSLVILDEPVSALDVSIQAQIMNLLRDLQEELNVAYFFIAHDLATVKYMSHRLGVMYLGKLVEHGPAGKIIENCLHPYTKALFSAAMPSHPDLIKEEIILTGEVPSAFNPPSGCRFHPRCDRAMPICSEVEPQLKEIEPDYHVACHLY